MIDGDDFCIIYTVVSGKLQLGGLFTDLRRGRGGGGGGVHEKHLSF